MIATLLAAGFLQVVPPSFEIRQFTSALTKEAAVAQRLVFVLGREPSCNEREMNGLQVSVCVVNSPVTAQGLAGMPVRVGQVGFDPSGLVLFRLIFNGADASAISAAMTAKFGQPCREEVSEWRNRMGAVLENPTTTWCLADGELSVEARSAQDPNDAELKFLSGRLTEVKAPVVDF
jgi:hypothetical protein